MAGLWQIVRSGHWPSLAGAWLHFECSFMLWLLIGALGVPIAQEFGLSATHKGLLVAMPILAGALLRIPVGLLSDRSGPKRVGVALLVCQAAALLWGWQGAESYRAVLAMGLLLGTAGASVAVALPVAARAYPAAHQGLAMGIAASANSGTVLAMFLAPRMADLVGWHGVFGLLLVPLALVTGSFVLLVRGDREEGCAVQETEAINKADDTAPSLYRLPSVYWLCFIYSVTFGGFVGLSSFLPIFFHDQYGLTPVAAGSLTALGGLVGSLIRPFGGYVADRVGGLGVLRMVFPLIAGLGVGLAQLPPWPVAVSLLIGLLAAMGFGNGVVFQVVAERFRRRIGEASGLIGAAGGLGGFLVPVWLGLLKDATGGFGGGFLLLGGVAVLAFVSVVLALARRRSATVCAASD